MLSKKKKTIFPIEPSDDGISFNDLRAGKSAQVDIAQAFPTKHNPKKEQTGDGGPFKLHRKTLTGHKLVRVMGRFIKQKEYGPWEEIGGFSALHSAIAYISRNRHEKTRFGVFLKGTQVYSI